MIQKRIMVIDDEKDIVDLISYNLELEKFAVIKAYDGESALEMLESVKPDLIILDLMLPVIRGLEVCRLIRKNPETESIPIIMLTARGDDMDRIIGFEMGADDYIVKPFNLKELIARIRAVLRRAETISATDKTSILKYKDLKIDYKTFEVTLNEKKVNLSPKALKILHFLAKNPGRVYSREQILYYIWGDDTFVEPRTVDAHICRLRETLEKDINNPQYIFTIRSFGYKFAGREAHNDLKDKKVIHRK
jgi:phosphate regulon transcriptional regulator PhoB